MYTPLANYTPPLAMCTPPLGNSESTFAVHAPVCLQQAALRVCSKSPAHLGAREDGVDVLLQQLVLLRLLRLVVLLRRRAASDPACDTSGRRQALPVRRSSYDGAHTDSTASPTSKADAHRPHGWKPEQARREAATSPHGFSMAAKQCPLFTAPAGRPPGPRRGAGGAP